VSRTPETRPRAGAWWPWSIVAGAVLWGLISLRAETVAVPYLNDSSMHEQMARVATAQLRGGHLPLTSWFPYLGEGSPQFLHYQSLPAMITGAVGLLTGGDVAFRWSLYLLLSLWPISVYGAARLFGGGRAAAAGAAAMSPFLMSATGVGYEQQAYVWIGYGVWTQLWAMWTLPLAWGFGWQAIRHGRHRFAAVLMVALSCAFHFETGYLAFAPLVLWPFVSDGRFAVRVRRTVVLLGGSLLAIAWVIVPLFAQRDWAATNQVLKGTALENGYGAIQVLRWLVSGGLLDHGRFPVVTIFAWIGVIVAGVRWRRDPNDRALLVALVVCLLMSFGRATFGDLVSVFPGSADIFFRRFMMGVQLAALLLAGRGAAWVATAVRLGLAHWRPPASAGLLRAVQRRDGLVLAPLALAAAVLVLIPAWLQLDTYDSRNAAQISAQRRSDTTQGAQVDQLISLIQRGRRGRTYAGMPSNFGADFTVGQVPVFKYLESRDVDEVGYTLRTASLMTDPENYFDENNPSDYRLFGVRYLILPATSDAPVPARRIRQVGNYVLWTLPQNGYVQVGTIIGSLAANRTNVGTQSISLLDSDLAAREEYLRVAFDRRSGSAHAPASVDRRPPGAVSTETDDLPQGRASATVTLGRAGAVILSASFDPGWTATVDGMAARTEMVAPALVGTIVPAGTHRVVFRYRGFSAYAWLLALSGLTLLGLLGLELAPVAGRRRERRTASVP
jgi:hypothetical protein